jgi:hypothetical protein
MDGSTYIMLINNERAVRGQPGAGFAEWLRPLLEPQRVLESELLVARNEKVAAGLSQDRGALVLRMAPKAKGDFTHAWSRNSSIPESDHVRVYRFDPATKRLAGLQVFVGDKVVFETVSIVYNSTLDPDLFELKLPANVSFFVPPEEMPETAALPATPRETAAVFFEACAAKDWERLRSVHGNFSQKGKDFLGGLTVISIGEPFQSGLYPGWFVPYEIRLANGYHKKFNLAVRNDNKARRWHVDGGY